MLNLGSYHPRSRYNTEMGGPCGMWMPSDEIQQKDNHMQCQIYMSKYIAIDEAPIIVSGIIEERRMLLLS